MDSNVKVVVRLRPVSPTVETSFSVTGSSTLAHVDQTGAPVTNYTLGAQQGRARRRSAPALPPC